MTIPAKYTLTEAHMKIAELEERLEAAEAERDAIDEAAKRWRLDIEAELVQLRGE